MFTRLSDRSKAVVYYALALAMVTAITPLQGRLGPMVLFLAMFTPLASVLLMQLVITRDGWSRSGWALLGLHRSGWRGWGLALLVPVTVLAVVYAIVWATGIGDLVVPSMIGNTPVNALFPLMVMVSILVDTFTNSLAEEVGWRGYLFPHLLRLGPGRAMVASGFLHGVWHLPLVFLTPYYHGAGNRWVVVPLFLATMTVSGAIFGYLRLTTDSVWPAALAHSTHNTLYEILALVTTMGSPLAGEYLAGESGLFTVIGYSLVALWLVRRLRSPRPVVESSHRDPAPAR